MRAVLPRTGPKPTAISPARASIDGFTETMRLFGHDPYPWQARVARIGLSRRKGRWRYPVVVVCVPRQSGKTRLVMSICVDRCLRQPQAQVWYTAQSRTDAAMRFAELVRLLRASSLMECPHRYRRDGPWDYRVRWAMGTEEVEFRNGAQLRIFAPAEDSLHGSVTDLIVLDEARFFDAFRGDALMAAALPTQATRDGQVWIASTAGGPDSTFLRRQVEIARSGGRAAIAEWGIDQDVPAGGLLEAVWAAHPAAGQPGGPRFEALEVAAEQMPAWQFAHEYGNRWRTEADVRLLPAALWGAVQVEAPLPAGRPVFAADVPLDRSESTIVACVDGVVELVDSVAAAAVPGRLLELIATWDPLAVVVDAAGPAGTVAERLRAVCDRLVISSTRDLSAACGMFYDSVLDGTAKVRPSQVLTLSAATARKRQIGQMWVWSRTDGGSPLVAVSLAAWQWQRQVAAPAAVQDWVAW